MSHLFVKTLRENPADAEVDSHKLLVRAGYIRRVAPGIYTWLPLGLRVLRKVEQIIREELDAAGAQEMLFPGLLPREPYEATNRWEEYGANLFRLKDRRENDYLLAPTHEEMFTLAVKDQCSSYKDLPLNLYQFQTKYRDEARPRAGLLRTREFVMKDAYSFDVDDAGLDVSYQIMRDAYERTFTRLGLPYVICAATSGAMGGSRSEEFLSPIEVGEDTFVVSDGGYAANTEAVTTAPLPELDFAGVPEQEVVATPDCKTIEALVDLANDVMPREDRPWQASDTLKNVVVVATHPTGERELVVIGMPGDREADLKRIEANMAPAEIEMATADDLASHPELVPGYIGPSRIGPNSPDRVVGEDGEISGSVRYFLDPHVARGSSWITGADAEQRHAFNVVYGRDFEADGFVEAVEVRDGDQAPDGSGPLRIERGMEIGHIFQLGRKYAEALDLTVLDQNGKSVVVTMGSYGIGVSRAVAALAELNHDDAGLIWPAHVAPAVVHVLATGKDAEIFEAASAIAAELDAAGVEVIYDDRQKVSAGVKFADFELIGVPYGVVVGRGLKDGKVELRDRRSGERREVALADAVAEVTAMIG
ncbi:MULTISPECIES: proline--tRNA ligase [Trueperella]|uniref:Proline--tRNA ligase n=1 Tax=Trueperella bernardiae TaxID=59561 RepID=A0AAW6ZKS1_9ACTO|nr:MULTISPECIES: proline--tRNA ligase [Trueperella]MCM3907324.1 proline--tRNA ligase [Trueperella bernardiae]MDK8601293.1 proline--tRNA ligase [Trueperella bernardiae]OCW61132.1 prolyl-tRNA synthetase [Trueperella bernardiae]OFS65762.1 proline--tRNA ligase [Trueperella sp. HMSC08H06]OFS75806.1 proline--tRNA ligase [Trueperella sp. HMSC08B05]